DGPPKATATERVSIAVATTVETVDRPTLITRNTIETETAAITPSTEARMPIDRPTALRFAEATPKAIDRRRAVGGVVSRAVAIEAGGPSEDTTYFASPPSLSMPARSRVDAGAVRVDVGAVADSS